MLCCLKVRRSRPTISRQVKRTPSIRLTTIRTYGTSGDFLKLDSSSTIPSNRSSVGAGNGALADGAPACGSGNVSCAGRSSDSGGAAGRTGLLWRRALSRFFSDLPADVR